MKETFPIEKYLELARVGKKKKKKNLWNMRVTVIPVVDGVLETVYKGYEKKRERIETIQTTALLNSAKILRRALETKEDLLSLGLQ